MEEHGPVQSIDRAFEILERLCGSRDGLSIHALSEATGLHKSTVHRLLAALAARGYVRKDEESGRYRMTTRICELSEQVVESLDVLKAAHGPMEALSQTTGETVHLVVREGDEIVYVHKVEPDVSTMRMFSPILHIPYGMVYLCIPLCGIFSLFYCVVRIVDDFCQATEKGGEET